MIQGIRNRLLRDVRRIRKHTSRSASKLSRRASKVSRSTSRATRKWTQRTSRRASKTCRQWIAGFSSVRSLLADALALVDVTYAPSGETMRCPACGSRDIQHLDTMWHFRRGGRRFVGFASGCRTCGIVFANPFPSAEALAEFYGGPASEYMERQKDRVDAKGRSLVEAPAGVAPEAARDNPRLRALFESLEPELTVVNPPPGSKVLDFGCGPGRLLDHLQALGWETYGIEPAVKSAFPRHGELEAPPDQPTFDLITVHHVLEHVFDPLTILQSLSRALKEGGFLYISVPRLDNVAVHGDLRYCINSRTHIVSYTDACLRTLLIRAGLTPIAVRNDADLDRTMARGERRKRLFARKLPMVPSSPNRPLEAAETALRAYYERFPEQAAYRVGGLAPVRLRAAWMQRLIAR